MYSKFHKILFMNILRLLYGFFQLDFKYNENIDFSTIKHSILEIKPTWS